MPRSSEIRNLSAVPAGATSQGHVKFHILSLQLAFLLTLSQKHGAWHWTIQNVHFGKAPGGKPSFNEGSEPDSLMQAFLINASTPLPCVGLALSAGGMCLWLCCASVTIIISSIFSHVPELGQASCYKSV